MILQNHGFLTVGALGRGGRLAVHHRRRDRARPAAGRGGGHPTLIRDEVAAPLGRSRAFGGFSFRPYYDEIVAEQPDLLD